MISLTLKNPGWWWLPRFFTSEKLMNTLIMLNFFIAVEPYLRHIMQKILLWPQPLVFTGKFIAQPW